MLGPSVEALANNINYSKWDFEAGSEWEEASYLWQDFYSRWRKRTEADVLAKETLRLDPKYIEILVRESYDALFRRIFAVARTPRRGVVITGQPGIGKTFFLWYALIRLITLRQIVLFARGSRLYLFYGQTVYTAVSPTPTLPELPPGATAFNAFIWTLIDVDYGNEPPAAFLVDQPCFPIQAATPNPLRFRAWVKQRSAKKMALPLWSCEELYKGLRLQPDYLEFREAMASYLPPSRGTPPPIPAYIYACETLHKVWEDRRRSEDDETVDGNGNTEREIDAAFRLLLRDAIAHFGLAAREVYEAVLSQPEEVLHAHELAIRSVTTYESLMAMIYHFIPKEFFDNEDVGYNVFAVFPDPSSHSVTKFLVDFKSPWVAKEVVRRIGAENERLVDMYRLLKDIPESSPLAGWFLEPIAFNQLLTSEGFLRGLVKMDGDTEQDAPTFKAALSSEKHDLKIRIQADKAVYYDSEDDTFVPGPLYIPNNNIQNPLFDALWIDYVESDTYILYIMQIRGSKLKRLIPDPAYEGSDGYALIRKVIRSLKKSESGKSVVVKVRYLYACAAEDQTVEWTMPDGWNENTKVVDHRGEVYCWRIPI